MSLLPIRFELRADDRASDTLRAVKEVLREGGSASEDAKAKMKSFTESLSLQNRALHTLRTSWRVSHPELFAFGRALSAVGSIGHTLLNIMTAISTAGFRIAGAKREAARATEDAQQAYIRWKDLERLKGPDSPEALQAKGEFIRLENEKKGAIEEVTAAEQAQNTVTAAWLLNIGDLASRILLAGTAIKAFGGFVEASAIGAAGGFGALAVGAGILGATIFKATSDAISFRNAVGEWPDTIQEARDVIGDFLKDVPLIGPVLNELQVHMTALVGDMGRRLEEAQKGFEDWRTSVEKTVNEWGANITESFFEWLTSAGGVIGSWGNSVVDWFFNLPKRIGEAMAGLASILAGVFKSAFNAVISVINRAIGGLNSIRVSIPGWVPGIGGASFGINLPTIPLLAQGGVITKPTLALLGEAGPEAVVPLGGSRSAFSPTINIYVQGSIVTEREITDMVSRRLFEEYSRLTR
jgi:hypothetical protein